MSKPVPIFIVNWNGFEDTIECIKSVLRMTFQNYVIYLIDNNSDNEEGDKLKMYYSDNDKIKVQCNDRNLGFTGAHNKALDTLDLNNYDFIALLNNDVVVDPFWLQNAIEEVRKNNIDVLSSKLIYYYDRTKLDNIGHQMLSTGEIIPLAYAEPVLNHNESKANVGSCAAATLYSASMIKKIGFFDPFFNTGYEDAELGLRALCTGHRCAYYPKAIAYHKIGRSIKKVFNVDYTIQTQVNIWYTYFKLMPWPVILLNLPFIIFKFILLSIINLLFNRRMFNSVMWSAAGTIWSRRKEIRRARKEFFKTQKIISWHRILARQRFFLGYDIKRFFNIFIRKQPSALDDYGRIS